MLLTKIQNKYLDFSTFVVRLFAVFNLFQSPASLKAAKIFVPNPSVISIPSLAFCDEEVITKRHEEHDNEVTSRQEMYSEQRKEMMNKQVTNLHQSKQEQHVMTSSSHVTEAQEWQQIAKKEKSYSEFAEQSHFSMQNMQAPNFSKPMEPVTVKEGEAASFHVDFSGQPNPAVTWYRYSFPVKDSKDFKINTTESGSTLTITKTCADDGGIFTCLLENIIGATKSSSNLNVMEDGQEYIMEASTKSMRTMKEMNINEGDNIRFDIGFSGGDKSNLEFSHNGQKIAEINGVSITVENEVASLLIEKANPSHSGLYECIMKTDGGEARCQVQCNITPAASAS